MKAIFMHKSKLEPGDKFENYRNPLTGVKKKIVTSTITYDMDKKTEQIFNCIIPNMVVDKRLPYVENEEDAKTLFLLVALSTLCYSTSNPELELKKMFTSEEIKQLKKYSYIVSNLIRRWKLLIKQMSIFKRQYQITFLLDQVKYLNIKGDPNKFPDDVAPYYRLTCLPYQLPAGGRGNFIISDLHTIDFDNVEKSLRIELLKGYTPNVVDYSTSLNKALDKIVEHHMRDSIAKQLKEIE